MAGIQTKTDNRLPEEPVYQNITAERPPVTALLHRQLSLSFHGRRRIRARAGASQDRNNRKICSMQYRKDANGKPTCKS